MSARAPISLRPAVPDDHDHLLRVYASTREAELALVPWSDAEKRAFVESQFRAQHLHYYTHFAAAEFSVIVAGEEPIGRLYVDRRPDEIRLVDIALLPEYRATGIGGALLSALIAEATSANLPLRIHVEHHNPARRLYERLGFIELSCDEIYSLMERPASSLS